MRKDTQRRTNTPGVSTTSNDLTTDTEEASGGTATEIATNHEDILNGPLTSTVTVSNTSKGSVSDFNGVTVQNPSPTRVFLPNSTLLETLATETEDNTLFEELSTPHNINIDSDANSLQSTESEIVSVASQSTTDDINDDVSEITTTADSAILSEEPITQTLHDTTEWPLTQTSEEALSDVSKKAFTTLNPGIERITNSSHVDQESASFSSTTVDSQSPEAQTSASIVSVDDSSISHHINISYQDSSQYLVTESTSSDINYSTSSTSDDQSPVVTGQGALRTNGEVTKDVTLVSKKIEETTTIREPTDYYNIGMDSNNTISVRHVTSTRYLEHSDALFLGSTTSLSSTSPRENLDDRARISIPTASMAPTTGFDANSSKTTPSVDYEKDTTEHVLDYRRSQSTSVPPEQTALITNSISSQREEHRPEETTATPEEVTSAGTDLISSFLNLANLTNPSHLPFEDTDEATASIEASGNILTNQTMFYSQGSSDDPQESTPPVSGNQLVSMTLLVNLTTSTPHSSSVSGTTNARVTEELTRLNYNPDTTEMIPTEHYTPLNQDDHKNSTPGNLYSTEGTLRDKMYDRGFTKITPASYSSNSRHTETRNDTPSLSSSTPILTTVTSQQFYSQPSSAGASSSTVGNVGRMQSHFQSTVTTTTTAAKNGAIIDGFNSTFSFPITNITGTTHSSKASITTHANAPEDTNSPDTIRSMEESSLGLFTTQGSGSGGGSLDTEVSTQNPDNIIGGGIITDNGKIQPRESITYSTPIAVSTVTTQSDGNGAEETTSSPRNNETVTTGSQNTTVQWVNGFSKTTTPLMNSSAAVTSPTSSVILGDKTSNVGKYFSNHNKMGLIVHQCKNELTIMP